MSILVDDDHDGTFYRIQNMESRDAFLADMTLWRKSCRITLCLAYMVWVPQLVLLIWQRSLGISLHLLFSIVLMCSIFQFLFLLHLVITIPRPLRPV